MVVSEIGVSGGHCGGATWSASTSVRLALPSFENVQPDNMAWAHSRAQQQLVVDTLQSLKDKAVHAFAPADAIQPLDPFRETFSDGGLFGAGCNYAVGFYGIQGRQPKCEDYVLHLALGPNLFAPFDDCARACLACILDGHGGTGAVQYTAERFPSYLLADLPRLRAQPAAAMRSALHRIDEELTNEGHNSGTTVNALLLVDNHLTVVNTGDCRCLVYDFIDERVVHETHDHNLQCSRERERVLGEGAELSGCGGYVVLPCPTDGAKLLGVTKALGHAGVKALQRSFTIGSLTGILEASTSPRREQDVQPAARELRLGILLRQEQERSVAVASRAALAEGDAASSGCNLAALDQVGRSCEVTVAMPLASTGAAEDALVASRVVMSGSGMTDDDPVMPASTSASAGDVGNGPGGQSDVDMCSSCSALTGHCLQQPDGLLGNDQEGLIALMDDPAPVDAAAAAASAAAVAATTAAAAAGTTVRGNSSFNGRAPVCFSTIEVEPAPLLSSTQRCCSHSSHGGSAIRKSSFATAAAAALAAVVASSPEPLVGGGARSSALTTTGTGGSFMLTCEPDEYEFTVDDDRHMVLVGCDGVFDHMKNGEACRTALRQLTSTNSCVDAAREVAHRACRLGSLDNITALVLRFGRKPIVRRQSLSVLTSLRRSSSNMSGDLAAAGGSVTSRF